MRFFYKLGHNHTLLFSFIQLEHTICIIFLVFVFFMLCVVELLVSLKIFNFTLDLKKAWKAEISCNNKYILYIFFGARIRCHTVRNGAIRSDTVTYALIRCHTDVEYLLSTRWVLKRSYMVSYGHIRSKTVPYARERSLTVKNDAIRSYTVPYG